MLRWSAFFLLFSLVAGIFAFGGILPLAVDAARVLFSAFLTFFLLTLVFAIFLGPRLKLP